MERLKKFQRLYSERERKYQTYHEGEDLFGLPQQAYPQLERMSRDLGFLERLYSLYVEVLNRVNGYEDILWMELDFQAITDEVGRFGNACKALPKPVKEFPAYKKLKKTIDDFGDLQPLLERLSDPAMRKRHWDQLQSLSGTEFKKDDEVFKLRDIMEANLLDFKEDVEDICGSAQKEADIEIKLNTLTQDWKDRELTFGDLNSRAGIILGKETGELMEQLEESQMTLGTIMASRYVAPFREIATGWMTRLTAIMETLDQWRGVQSMWMYLEAVFNSGDIASQLPQEAKKFSAIDKTWQKIMAKANATPNVIRFCYDNEMLKSLPSLKEQLEQCQKSLSGYLEQKRDIFPRFYFTSDPVLLEILSQSSDPHAIQSQLSQIFDSMTNITFDSKIENKVLAMSSGEGETVQFTDPIIAKGNVEDWLQKLEEEMQRTLKNIVRECSEECKTLGLRALIDKYPAQVALLGIQFGWTYDCETAIRKMAEGKKEDKKAMADAQKKVDGILNELTTLTTQNWSPRDRTKIETLITIQVHQKDVFTEQLKKLKDPNDFEWQKQARFYWQNDTCVILIADIEQEYCYEYLGCKERLVITQLTDRCYITLSQAIGLKLGGAPAGPAGTGKTETVKDLARTLGKYVVVFNCSDQLDYRAMGKIFRGLAQSGAWGCFDEFNRIDLEVLSVVAQQVERILSALRSMRKEFMFTDGKMCKLIDKTAMFITMNPGYQGRQELPENLKVQFRGVAMMVPDRRMIIRVKLAAAGYKKNDVLSKKFDVLYRLCEQQLSKQPHYDFGLRNILSVLRTAGEIKRQNPDKKEEFLLMRTLKDMNTSKLVAEDIPLFSSLLADLFPGITPDQRTFPELEAELSKQVEMKGLEFHPEWVTKVIQLYETSVVRHGIMVVGPSGAGKSECYDILLKAISVLQKKHIQMRMNPKAITAPQMFGKLDPVQNEWTDGIFSALWRKANQKNKKNNVWIVCDGPVDAIWIENLNTVLDDNKLLTLANGDRIPMASDVKMCFEVENLNNASPATVSRAGQIYMSESVLGWRPVLTSRLKGKDSRDGKPFGENETAIIRDLFEKYTDNGMEYVRKELLPKMAVPQMNPVLTCYDILYGVVKEHHEGKELEKDHLERLFLFSYTWAIGGLLEDADRRKFNDFVKKQTNMGPNTHDTETVFDYFVDKGTKSWRLWSEVIPEWKYPENDTLDFTSLYIPTADSVRATFILDKLAKQKKHVLFLGGSGTAKTVTVENYLYGMDADVMLSKKINFSSATAPGIFQQTIESKIEKRLRVYGPPNNRKMTVFVDDINMPEINEWGDQITNEIVRQLVEYSGFYALGSFGLAPGEYVPIEDLQFIAAMSHPGGGKNDIPNRLKRHFSIFNLTLPVAKSIEQMYGSIIRGRYNATRLPNQKEMVAIADKMTDATIALWRKIQDKMLPTPSKFHYIFNLRDLSRIYQGIMLSPLDRIPNANVFTALWKHECTRVFSDRLNDVKDKIWFDENVNNTIKTFFGQEVADKTKHASYFVNFLGDPIIDEITGEEREAPKIYELAESIDSLRPRLENFMNQYNENSKSKKLDLVLFDAAIKHLIRISRIISMPRGCALLVGVGGSGKQSLTRLASYIAGYDIKQIVLHKTYSTNNLFDDLRELYKLCGGVAGKSVTFIMTDAEIKSETFLEYINSILSSGEVPNLFAKEDLDGIVNDLRIVAKKQYPDTLGRNDTWDNLYRFFINRVRDNMHIVLCFSPVGEKFRNRALKFPALISGCSVDWFFPWPEDALVNVAKKFLSTYKIECEDDVKDNLIRHMANVHLSMTDVAREYFQRYRRHVYTTPKSFLSFILLYMDVYSSKLKEIKEMADKVNLGLGKLQTAGEDVKQMQVVLKEKEVNLHLAQKQIEELLKEIAVSTAKAEKKKEEVQAVKDALEVEFKFVSKGKQEAEKDLEAAKPALQEAEEALKSITPKDITNLKALKSAPPQLVKTVFDGVLLLMQLKIDVAIQIMDGQKLGKIIKDSWPVSQKLLADIEFLKKLESFDRNAINDETVELLNPYIRMESFNADAARSASNAAAGLCIWVRAMCTYHEVAKDVAPKIATLNVAEAKLAVASKKLQAQEAELAIVQEELNAIQAKFDEAGRKKQALQEDAEKTRRFMEQANNLIGALADEKDRWTIQSNEFKDLIRRLTGDVALASAFISYCGPFNSEFRKLLLSKTFYTDCVNRNIPVTKDLVVTKLLTDEAQIGEWNIEGLPTDDHSVQNAIMVTRSSKWPLLVDPQGQGLAWLKKRKYSDDKIQFRIARLTDARLRTVLEECMENGYPLIIENIEEEVDPMLDPVLEKNFLKGARRKQIVLSDKTVDYDDRFQLFLTTKLANPHYSPELYAKTTVIDFTVTMGGLEQQLLGYVIQKERAELEEQREKLLQDVNQNQKNIKAFEAELLLKLTTSDKNLLEDEELIAVLARTKKAAAEVKEKLIVARETEKRINLSREEYRPVAIRGSVLYFLIVETSDINPMYQTSLKQFLSLFDVAIQQAPQSNVSKARIEFIIETLTFHIYKYISRGLFKRHKFLFVLLMACKILLRAGKLQHEAFTALLKGGALLDIKSVRKNQCDWLGDTAWLNIINLSNSLDVFKSLPDLIQRNEKIWNRFYDEEKPEKATIPELHDKLTTFQRLLLVRSLREDRAILASHDFVKETLGEKYIDPIPISLDETWRESANNVPLVCLLSPGSDPTSMIEALAKTHKKDIVSVSMGQGQEKRATELLTTGFSNGTWVLLQNCHLGLKFISTIEDTIRNTEAGAQQSDKAASSGAAEQAQTATGGIHPDFRLWVTSEPNPKFAIGLLQMSIKLTLEGEVGMKAGMKSAFECVSQDMIDASRRPEWRPLLYSTCFLNSIVMERRKFGSLGWNISYEFNYADLKASLAFLQNHFAAIGEPKKGGGGPEISWPTVKYMICEVHYGGKITDDKDRDLFLTYGERWITPEVAKETFQFCEGYGIPQSDDKTQRQKFVEYIEKIPQIDNPEVFGLNGNADITYRTDETMNILSTILDIQPKESAGGSGETREDKVKAMAESLLGKLPEDFNQDVTQKNIARQGGMKSSLNVFLGQEIDRLQRLIGLTRKTLSELILAIDGTIIMSAELQDALNNLYDGRVPTKWVKLSWEATTIGLWFTELLGRREQLHNWLMKERPKSFWLTGFYNPQGFLTAVRQEVTRAHQQQGWALDDVFEKTEVTKYENKDDVGKLDEGVYIHGLYLEGGAWDRKGCRLIESQPKILFVPLPVIHITAVLQQPDNKTKYKCPVYRNKKRNDLTYIFSVDLNCTTATDTKTALEAKAKWKLRGVALLCNYQ